MRGWIVGAIGAVLVGSFLVVAAVRWQASCRYDATRAQLVFLRMKIAQYEYDTRRWPRDLKGLVHDDGSEGWAGPYAKMTDLKDAWADPVEYRLPGGAEPPVLASRGRLEVVVRAGP